MRFSQRTAATVRGSSPRRFSSRGSRRSVRRSTSNGKGGAVAHRRLLTAATAAATLLVGLAVSNHGQTVRAQVPEKPSQQAFIPRSGTAVPRGFEVLRVLGQIHVIAGAGGN